MNQESKINENYSQNQERVIKHLQRTDWLFIGLPIVLAGILLIILPIGALIFEKARGERTDFQGFDMGGFLIIAGIILFLIFCGGFGLFAFVLTLLTRRNLTFRVLLFAIPLLTLSILSFWAFRNTAPHVPMETQEIPAETEQLPVAPEETPEETPAESGRLKIFYYSEKDALHLFGKSTSITFPDTNSSKLFPA